ncbi:hypothetical protein [Paenibacillus lautus]|nr:hypothetical protein [Paenibacillus lautus]MBU5346532.1 hypothetical protein [Paenibacillus lautus]
MVIEPMTNEVLPADGENRAEGAYLDLIKKLKPGIDMIWRTTVWKFAPIE